MLSDPFVVNSFSIGTCYVKQKKIIGELYRSKILGPVYRRWTDQSPLPLSCTTFLVSKSPVT